MEKPEQTVRDVVGENVRRIREAAGARQDDVASAARAVGLTWTRSKIAALERGDKALDVADVILLAQAMGAIAGRPVSIAGDLFAGDSPVALLPQVVIQRGDVQRYLSGDIVRLFPIPGERTDGLFASFPDSVHAQVKAGEVEERAGRILGISKLEVAHLAVGLWGLTLGEERDRRVGDDLPPASRAAKRGQVTRKLVEDLRVRLTEVRDVER